MNSWLVRPVMSRRLSAVCSVLSVRRAETEGDRLGAATIGGPLRRCKQQKKKTKKKKNPTKRHLMIDGDGGGR